MGHSKAVAYMIQKLGALVFNCNWRKKWGNKYSIAIGEKIKMSHSIHMLSIQIDTKKP